MNDKRIHPWPHEDVASDFHYAVCGDSYIGVDTRMIGLGESRMGTLTEADVDEVVRWYVSYREDGKWEPGMGTGTELSLYAVLRLHGGRWASVVAGNDYTGWGCQGDYADVRIGDSEEAVVAHGLDAQGRSLLGYQDGMD